MKQYASFFLMKEFVFTMLALGVIDFTFSSLPVQVIFLNTAASRPLKLLAITHPITPTLLLAYRPDLRAHVPSPRSRNTNLSSFLRKSSQWPVRVARRRTCSARRSLQNGTASSAVTDRTPTDKSRARRAARQSELLLRSLCLQVL